MRVCSLASGSKGNLTAIDGGHGVVLVDFGLSARESTKRLKTVGVTPDDLAGVLFTHNHDDHCKGIGVFSRKTNVPLFANEGTAEGIAMKLHEETFDWNIFETSQTFTVGGMEVEAFSVSHDAVDPVGYCFRQRGQNLFLATDLGIVTELVRQKMMGCQTIILESNHDYDMLMESNRSMSLKGRIKGKSGHLSNDQASEAIQYLQNEKLHRVMLAHLSDECNTPALSRQTMNHALKAAGREDVDVVVLNQLQPTPWFDV